MSLQAPVAEIKLRSGAQVWANSISAIYQSQASMIDMFGDVTVTHQDGTRFVTASARVNAAQNAAEGNDPVAGHGPAGEIKAQGFRIIDKGDTIIFTGRADMLLNGARRTVAKSAPPSLPAPVAQLASQVEAEAKPAAPVIAAGSLAAACGQSRPPLAAANRPYGPENSAEMANSRTVRRKRIGLTASAWVLFSALSWSPPGQAQIGMPGASGGDDGPIRIQADSGIEWQQNQRVYIARGNAVAGRGNNEVRADTLIAYYREKAGAKRDPKTEANTGLAGGLSAEGGDNIEIFRVEAVGNVVLKREASTVVGERAVYDIDQGIAMITGANLKLTTATDVVTARDCLEWYEGKQIAVARGDAVATRSGKTIKADILTAYMRKSATPPAKGATPAAGLRRASLRSRRPARYLGRYPRRRRARRRAARSPAEKRASCGSAASTRRAML